MSLGNITLVHRVRLIPDNDVLNIGGMNLVENINWNKVEKATENLNNVVKQRQEGIFTWLELVSKRYDELKFEFEGS